MHKQRHNILYQLWLFGRYGQFPEENVATLVIDSEPHGSSKEFTGAVRKRDNTLHSSARMSTRLLQDFGVTIAHVPTGRRDWLLEMSVDDESGGINTLGALRGYAAALVGEHGEPTYRGSYRYKGEAYARFSRADMRVPSHTVAP